MLDTFDDLAIAKQIVKRAIRRKGIKISHISREDIAHAAHEVMKHPKMLKAERYNIKRRKEPSHAPKSPTS